MARISNSVKVLDQQHGERFSAYLADCVEGVAGLPDASVDFSVYSPPFSSLYIYSESCRDMGNVDGDDAFQESYRHLVREKLRATKPGRLTSIHVKDLVYYSNASERGDRGMRDFTGECIRTHVEEGWTYHARTTIWRCPVREMQKSKPDGLLFKNFRTDAGRVRQGLPEYLITFRKWAPGMDEGEPIVHDPSEFPLEMWQSLASPVWNFGGDSLPETDVLNVRQARDDKAEKHLCPMPLNITERAVALWSNRGDTVLSPFMGIGSEGHVSLRSGRRFIGFELNPTYFNDAVANLRAAEQESAHGSLLSLMGA